MRMMRKRFWLGAVCIALFCVSAAAVSIVPVEERAEVKTVKLLTIGNSFSGNATWLLPEVVEAAGHELVLGRADHGGCWLKKHWMGVEAYEKDPNDPAGKLYPYPPRSGQWQSLKYMLELEEWDVVTIQQLSTISDVVERYRPFAGNLYRYIRTHAPQAEVMMHKTWAYRSDDHKFGDRSKDHEDMFRNLTAAYETIAGELGVRIIPVADGFIRAYRRDDWQFVPDTEFDYENAEHPELPDQTHSLHVGWQWLRNRETGELELNFDGHHANQAGRYMGACVFFETLYEESVVGNSYVPEGMTAEDVRILQEVAHEVVSEKRRNGEL